MPKRNAIPFSSPNTSLPLEEEGIGIPLTNYPPHFCLFPILDISPKWDYSIQSIWLLFLISKDPRYYTNACYNQVIFHCIDAPQHVSLLFSRWACPLFVAWPYDAQCSHDPSVLLSVWTHTPRSRVSGPASNKLSSKLTHHCVHTLSECKASDFIMFSRAFAFCWCFLFELS